MAAAGEGLGTVQRVLHVIRFFAKHPEASLKEMAADLSLPPSTCHRLLELMCREDFIQTVPNRKRYRVGVELLRISAEIQSKHDICDISMPFLTKIVDQCGETTVFSLLLPTQGKLCYAAKVNSPDMLRYDIELNRPISAIWGASGRSIIAYLSKEQVDSMHAKEGAAPGTGEPLPTRQELEAELEKIRHQGFAITAGQKVSGSIGISAPVFDGNAKVIGSLTIVSPHLRVRPEDQAKMAELVKSSANAMSTTLGSQRQA